MGLRYLLIALPSDYFSSKWVDSKDEVKRLLWSRGSMLIPKFAGSNPAEAIGFLGRKYPQHAFHSEGKEKPSVPCRSFTACKRSLNVRWKSAFRQNLPDISRPQFYPPPLSALAW